MRQQRRELRAGGEGGVMTDQEILRSAIQKAAKNGYTPVLVGIIVSHPRMMGKNTLWEYYHKGIIFSHKFAKAFWGEQEAILSANPRQKMRTNQWHQEAWKSHLEIMVLEKNPIKYLEKFL